MQDVQTTRHCPECNDRKRVKVERGTGWWQCPVCMYTEAPRPGAGTVPPWVPPTESDRDYYFQETLAQLEIGRQQHGDSPYFDAVENLARVHFGRTAEETAEDRVREEADRERKLREQHLALAERCTPRRYFQAWRDGERPRKGQAMLAASRASQAGADVLILSGPPGSGKTYACAYALWGRALNLAKIGASEPPGIVAHARVLAKLNPYDTEHKAMRRKVRSMGLLVIDDLGVEVVDKNGDWLGELCEMLDARRDRRLATWITTNLDAETLAARYGERVSRRLGLPRSVEIVTDRLGGGESEQDKRNR